jgi:hypothetical protein
MLRTKRVEVTAPAGNSCARSGHFESDFSTFDDFEQELLEAIAAVEETEAPESTNDNPN